MLVAISAASELGYRVSAFQIMPKLFSSVFIICEFYDIYLCDSGKEREVNCERRDQTETDRCSHRTCKNL